MKMHRTDLDIKNDVMAELKWTPDVKETDIGVIVKDGAVTLTGSVPFHADRYGAGRAAKRINGVRALVNDIQVQTVAQRAGSRHDIAEHLARMFEWDNQIPDDFIRADVEGGVVSLSGEVEWPYQRDYIQRRVENTKGVISVANNIIVQNKVHPSDVKTEIVNALKRHAGSEASHIRVAVDNGVVTLTGHVDNYPEKELIERTALHTAGVMRVVNKLAVEKYYSAAAA